MSALGDYATFAGALVAAVAVGVASWAAYSAKNQAKYAQRHAEAAEAQIALMRQDRQDRRTLQFALTAVHAAGEIGSWAARLALTMVSGPPLETVVLTASGP
ncbi:MULTISPECIES: hypothetical protein [unclassified Crossiella]|uniref:hypothetical protein n=1 Tax=unclassified Crossiella TaxID=2620835 RepID=UPI001FFF9D05|nr:MULTISPECIES: hypothetical protein [unclassified Crossiella]MCK2240938.1 hypothetical protein [Crossiella sp. S99.2]MCK2253918.1 hypothetical protein [Crossiella sp. S99.1]